MLFRSVERAFLPLCLSHLHSVKRGEIEHAIFKRDNKEKTITIPESDSEELAITKGYVTQCGICHYDITHITIHKFAFRKFYIGEIDPNKIALRKDARFIFLSESFFREIYFFKCLVFKSVHLFLHFSAEPHKRKCCDSQSDRVPMI